MKKMPITKILFICSLLVVFQAQAAVVEGLYETEVVVASQSKSLRSQAMKTALIEVLTKVSGRPDVSTAPEIATALEKPASYVQQFRYRKIPEKSFLLTDAAAGSQLLWMRFDEKAVNRLLQKNNLPVWGRTRPATLVWLAVEQDGTRYLVGSNAQEEVRFILESIAQKKGISVLLPLLDLEDQNKINYSNVWGNNQEAIFLASTRYQSDAILVGTLHLSAADKWQGRWIFYEGGQGLSWNSQGENAVQAISSGVLGTLEILGSRYAQVYDNSSPGVFDIAVVDINSLKDFAKVAGYLQSLEQVKNVYPSHIGNNSVTYRLDIRGNSQGLIQTIKLGNVLAAVGPMDSSGPTGSQPFSSNQQIEIQEAASTTAHTYRLKP